ncbi:Protein CBG21953 [Caenorhabditis briggsae]|uniref:Protein CBG21953 n=1 Tax=Caenorhabditis briggsae TaxID=6238 RepID=A8Y154_CAEBR|nr:Protein CBG21953 [Caenorhabditis briggsae]CAP38615.2 Protein CBG21953 [Caenorhabditis briggsae]
MTENEKDYVIAENGGIFEQGDLIRIASVYMVSEYFDLDKFNEKVQEQEQSLQNGSIENVTLKNQDGLLKELLGCSKQCRIYGSTHQFLENLTEFQDFPCARKYFPLKFTTPYYVRSPVTTPLVYKSSSGQRFVCKQDLFPILQYLVRDSIPSSNNQMISTLISIFLKSKEDVANGKMEFLKFEILELHQLQRDLQTTENTYIDETGALKSTIFQQEVLEKLRKDFGEFSENFDELAGKFLKLIPTTWTTEESLHIKNELENHKILEKNFVDLVICVYTNTICIFKKLEATLKKWAELPAETTVIRLFEDGNERFLLKDELLEALKIPDYQQSNRDIDNSKFIRNPLKIRKIKPKSKNKNLLTPPVCTDKFYGISLEDAEKKYRLQTTNIDFIRFPIRRTAHRAIPILGPPATCGHAQFFISAVDAMLEVLKSLIWGSRLFQKFPMAKKKVLYEIFADLSMIFESKKNIPTLIKLSKIREVTNFYSKKCAFHKKTTHRDLLDDSENVEFTLSNLKAELQKLELSGIFPEILEVSDFVFLEISAQIGEEQTIGIWFDAVESCQLICILNLFPKLKTFLHAQKSCHRIPGLACATCPEFRNSESQNSEDVVTSSEEFPRIGRCHVAPVDFVKVLGFPDAPEDPEEDITYDSLSDICLGAPPDDSDSEDDDDDDDDIPPLLTYRPRPTTSEIETQTDEVWAEIGRDDVANLEKVIVEVTKSMEELGLNWKEKEDDFELFKREMSQDAKRSDAKIKLLERDLNRSREKNVQLKKKILETQGLARENSQLRSRILELETRENRLKDEKKSEIAQLTRKIENLDTKIDHLEKDLKKSQDRNEALKNIFHTNANLNGEIQRLKIGISEAKIRENQTSEAYEKMKTTFNEDRTKFSERIAEATRSIRSEKMRISELETTVSHLRRQLRIAEERDATSEIHTLKENLLEKTRYIQIIHETNVNLNTELERDRQKFREISRIIGKGAEPTQNRAEPIPQQHHSINFQQAPLAAPKLRPIGAERARNAAPNHQNSTSTPSTSSTISSPPIFVFPAGFGSNHLEICDPDCVICLSQVRSTDKMIKCQECRRRFHWKCAANWLQVNSICPTCKGKLLDPEEFPAL